MKKFKAKILHTDGKTKVNATVFESNGEFECNYSYQGLSYSQTLTEDQFQQVKVK
jgi:hypothetical protein